MSATVRDVMTTRVAPFPPDPISSRWSAGEGTLDPVITDPDARTGNWLAGGSEMPDVVSQTLHDYP